MHLVLTVNACEPCPGDSRLIRIIESLGRKPEGICHTIKEREHGDHVDCLGDLFVRPAAVSQQLNFCCRTRGRSLCNKLRETQQLSLGVSESSQVNFARSDLARNILTLPLQLQEVPV